MSDPPYIVRLQAQVDRARRFAREFAQDKEFSARLLKLATELEAQVALAQQSESERNLG